VFVIGANLYGVLFFLLFFCLINIGQLYVLSVSVCSGVVFQPAHCTVSLKILTAASVPSSVLRETFKVSLWLMRCLKSSQFVCYCLSLVVFLGSAHVVLVLPRPENDRRIGQNMILLQRSLGEYPS
jgi:hypothetical protein